MNREISFRAWTGKTMMYQDQQYLGSFLRRVVMQIMLEHGSNTPKEHESYLPKGTTIEDYLQQYTGLQDKNDKKIYDGDILRYGFFALNDINKFGDEPWLHLPEGVKETDITTVQSIIVVKWNFSTLYAIQQHIYENPDVTGVEVIGNIHENPELTA